MSKLVLKTSRRKTTVSRAAIRKVMSDIFLTNDPPLTKDLKSSTKATKKGSKISK